ncbi:TPA_asm: M [Agave tequilana virus 1]|uniref:M n=1 Tax=Agave tequilana virus 1 TaxID=2793719 RepID=A0A8D9PGR6_9RHAB|nr:M [Agave tequilana virus 1] [Agave tequilana virus 1]DAF42281.1 TPA_asm: M [Agave tequilana virus 1]
MSFNVTTPFIHIESEATSLGHGGERTLLGSFKSQTGNNGENVAFSAVVRMVIHDDETLVRMLQHKITYSDLMTKIRSVAGARGTVIRTTPQEMSQKTFEYMMIITEYIMMGKQPIFHHSYIQKDFGRLVSVITMHLGPQQVTSTDEESYNISGIKIPPGVTAVDVFGSVKEPSGDPQVLKTLIDIQFGCLLKNPSTTQPTIFNTFNIKEMATTLNDHERLQVINNYDPKYDEPAGSRFINPPPLLTWLKRIRSGNKD